MRISLFFTALLYLQLGCSGGQPAATEYKNQLTAGTVGSGGGGGGSSGNATNGKTFLTDNCSGCHNDSVAPTLTGDNVQNIKDISSGTQTVDKHNAKINSDIKANQADIIAALGGGSSGGGGGGGGTPAAGDAKVGLQVVTTTCNNCHGKTQGALTKASAAGVEAAGKRQSHAGVAPTFQSNSADIVAYLNSL